MDSKLATAFRFHMRNARPAFYHAQGYNGKNAWPEKAHGIAKEAIARARKDISEGKSRYHDSYIHRAHRDSNGMIYLGDKPENFGLRLVGRVMAEPYGRAGYWDKSGDSGWYTDPYGDVFKDGTGLCYGLVYQLPGRDGHARFVTAYEFGGMDESLVFDMSRVFSEDRRAGSSWDSPEDSQACRDAIYHADSMAKYAAEQEREYQAARQAGSQWADEQSDIAATRAEVMGILQERRAVKGTTAYPALCRAITARVRDLLGDIAERRERARKLASGDAGTLSFYDGDKRLREAFNEGAGESVLS